MLNKNIYAVVDLETTHTSLDHGRVIQIAIAFVQNDRVINQFSTLVNPGEPIPKHVTKLTGITDAQVAQAPYFDEVAHTIHAMLDGATFVAHNVNFDLPFLNAAFERVGLTGLKSTAIDTVTLSQILWPTAPGYRLQDMAKLLEIGHDRPHQADSDALTTAELFIAIQAQAARLPMVTLQSLVDLPMTLPRETQQVFQTALQQNRETPQPLDKHLQVVDGLAIRRFSAPTPLPQQTDVAYPNKQAEKVALYGDQLSYRAEQAHVMNTIYQHEQQDEDQPLVLEAPTGVGKTLGYLLPLAYLAQQHQRRVIVAVPTVALQQQVTETVNQQLNALLPFEVRAANLKGRKNYLNLQSFRRALRLDEGTNSLQMIKAQILVWLTLTLTGDFDEVNLINPQPTFMAKLAQNTQSTEDSAFTGYEFSERQHVVAERAQFAVVNHAYLASYAHDLGARDAEQQPYLLIDEPQALPDAVIDKNRQHIAFRTWLTHIETAQEFALESLFSRLPGGRKIRGKFKSALQVLEHEVAQLELKLYRRFLMTQKQAAAEGEFELELDANALVQFWIEQEGRVAKIQAQLSQIQSTLAEMTEAFNTVKTAFAVSERQAVADFRRELDRIGRFGTQLSALQQEMIDYPDASVYWLTQVNQLEQRHLTLSGGLLHTQNYFKQRVYPFFKAPTLIGATVFTSAKSSFLFDRLDLDPEQVATQSFGDVFDYANQAKLVMVEDAPAPESQYYTNYLAQMIAQVIAANQENTLVLFNSLETIRQVYHRLHELEVGDRSILAQGLSGSPSRLIKRMQNEAGTVILGTGAFWEGVDFKGEQVRQVIITRLPFEQPHTIPQKAEEVLLKRSGKQPFYHSTLPKAVLKLRQGVGRLLRSPEDYGVIVVLDPRIHTKSYGKTLRKMLPSALPQELVPKQAVAGVLKKFLKKHAKSAD